MRGVVSSPVDEVLQSSTVDSRIENSVDFPFGLLINDDGRERGLVATRESAGMIRLEEGDVEYVVNLHLSGEGESIGGSSNLLDDGEQS